MNVQSLIDTANQWIVTNAPVLAMKLLGALVIFFVGYWLIQIAVRSATFALERTKKLPPLLRAFVQGTIRNVLWLILLLMVASQFGVDITALVAGVGVAGFVLGFAFQDSLSNLAAGFMILLNQPYEIDHYVDVAGTAGVVKEMNITATTLMTPDNKRITIPNSKIWGTTITNYSVMPTRRVEWKVGVDYSASIGKTKTVIREVLERDARIRKDSPMQVELLEMGNSALLIVVRAWVATPDFWEVFFKINQEIKEALDVAGIAIPYPQVDVHFGTPLKFDGALPFAPPAGGAPRA